MAFTLDRSTATTSKPRISLGFTRHPLTSLFLLLLSILALPAAGHEVVLIERSQSGIAAEPRSLPVVVPGEHVSLSSSVLDFGTLLVGQQSSASLTVTNTSEHSLEISLDDLPEGMSYQPAGLTLSPMASGQFVVTWSPSAPADLTGAAVAVHSSHFGVAVAQTDSVAVVGAAYQGAELEFRMDVGGSDVAIDAFDFGIVTRRLYKLEEIPSFDLKVVNVGDLPAQVDIEVGWLQGGPRGLCSNETGLCVDLLAGTGTARNFQLAAGAQVTTRWSQNVLEPLPDNYTVTISYESVVPTKSHDKAMAGALTFGVAYEGVPHTEVSGFEVEVETSAAGRVAVRKSTGPSNGGDATDSGPGTTDPFSTYRPKGLDVLGVFQASDVDTVEVRSGNLSVAIPLASFQVGGRLDWGLTLRYNSNLWKKETIWGSPGNPRPSEFPDPANNSGMGWSLHMGRLFQPIDDWAEWQSASHHEKEKRFHPGHYWTYVSPDGREIRFSKDLNHQTSPYRLDGDPSLQEFLYARDGSHLRLRKVSGNERHVEFPDGRVQVFERSTVPYASMSDLWRLTEIRSPFSDPDAAAVEDCNCVRVDYQNYEWTISDPHRKVFIDFVSSSDTESIPNGGPSEFYPVVAKAVRLPGFNGAGERQIDIDYEFHRNVSRPSGDLFHLTWDPAPPSIDVPTVVKVTLPGQQTLPEDQQSAYHFDYYGAGLPLGHLRMRELKEPAGARVQYEYALIEQIIFESCHDGPRYPEVGLVRRTVLDGADNALSDTRYLRQYRGGYLPEALPAPAIDDFSPCALLAGADPEDFIRDTPPQEQLVGVWMQHENALASLNVQYYSVWPYEAYDPSLSGDDRIPDENDPTLWWTRREKDLNMTRSELPRDDRFLSSRRYSCSISASNNLDTSPVDVLAPVTTLASACDLQESDWVRYELPQTDVCELKGGTACHIGARIVESETLFHSDTDSSSNPRSILVTKSDYDGLGNYRTEIKTNDFPEDGQAETRFRDFNSGNGTLILRECPVRPQVGNPCAPGSVAQDIDGLPETWVLATLREHSVARGNVTREGDSCYDKTTGVLLYERTWEGSAPGADDLLVRHEYNALGERAAAHHHGADTGNITAGLGLCNQIRAGTLGSLPDPDYTEKSEYEHGQLVRQWVEGTSIKSLDLTVDKKTSWTRTKTLDSDEVQTFDYDELGRIKSLSSDRTGSAQFVYRLIPRGLTHTWQVESRSYPQGLLGNRDMDLCDDPAAWESDEDDTAGKPLTLLCSDLDERGRALEERAHLGGSTWASQRRTYHPSGTLASVSMVNDSGKTQEFDYDWKGRITKITNPEPDNSEVRTSYTGIRSSFQKTDYLSPSGERERHVTRKFDALGRKVVQWVQSTADPSTGFTPYHYTTYSYDPNGALTRVVRRPTKGDSSSTQVREFTVDGRGFVTKEFYPEFQPSNLLDDDPLVNDDETLVKRVFSNFNTRGQAKTVKFNGRTETRGYDDLGRPEWVAVRDDGQDEPTYEVKRWSYYPSGDGKGKLWTAVRNNWRTPDDNASLEAGRWQVSSTYGYDPAGRTASRTTTVDFIADSGTYIPNSGTFQQSWAWDDLGRLDTTTYPSCQNTGCINRGDREVTQVYENGLLTEVSAPGSPELGWADLGASLAYHLDGSVHKLTHAGNGGVDIYGKDDSGLSRVGSVQLGVDGNGVARLNLGSYTYDGAGNITHIGAGSTFAYDGAGRLAEATVRGTDYRYDFDPYDNITNFGTVEIGNNRLKGVEYNPFGSLTSAQGFEMSYDKLDKVMATFEANGASSSDKQNCLQTGVMCQLAIYDHNDLRILSSTRGNSGAKYTWSLRDLGGRVLREFEGLGSGLEVSKEFTWAGSRQIASKQWLPTLLVRRYHTDHLGSARLVNEGFATREVHYAPFGTPIGNGAGETLDYTGHERDANGKSIYMRGRTFLSMASFNQADGTTSEAGRFLQIDPARDGWNLYGYTGGNPVNNTDPSGLKKKVKVTTVTWFGPFTREETVLERHETVYTTSRGDVVKKVTTVVRVVWKLSANAKFSKLKGAKVAGDLVISDQVVKERYQMRAKKKTVGHGHLPFARENYRSSVVEDNGSSANMKTGMGPMTVSAKSGLPVSFTLKWGIPMVVGAGVKVSVPLEGEEGILPGPVLPPR